MILEDGWKVHRLDGRPPPPSDGQGHWPRHAAGVTLEGGGGGRTQWITSGTPPTT